MYKIGFVKIGNTNTVAAFAGKRIVRIAEFPTGTGLKYRLQVRSALAKFAENCGIIVFASVVPACDRIWEKAGKSFVELRFLSGTRAVKPLRRIRYAHPSRLGADRIACSMGAIALYPGKNRIVVDAGTAITVNWINDRDEFMGGFIFCGPDMALESLHKGTALLPRILSGKLCEEYGRDTVSGMRQGAMCMAAGGIEKAVQILRKQIGNGCVQIATGGGWPFLRRHMTGNFVYKPDLIFEGLKAWSAKFSAPKRKPVK